jgi:hypothetical protein
MANLAPRRGGENLSCRLGRWECGGRHSAISVLRATDHCGNAVGWHRAKIADRWGTREPDPADMREVFRVVREDIARGLRSTATGAAVQCRRVDPTRFGGAL